MDVKSKDNRENKRLLGKLKSKYRLVILNEQSFEERFSSRLSPLNVITGIGVAFLVVAFIFISTIVFTPIKEFIPGYTDSNVREMAIEASLKVDSIEGVLRIRDQYVQNLLAILHGNPPMDSIDVMGEDGLKYANLDFDKSDKDSILRKQVEEEDRFNFSLTDDKPILDMGLGEIYFFTPLKGEISQKFNAIEEHYGVDIVTEEGASVQSVLPGTVVFSGWTQEGGNVVQILHEGELLSVYKHNSKIFTEVGQKIKAGESIAIVGNTGEFSTGPHLHFELWRKGIPVNPEHIIEFK
ncbi:MAG: biotin carboxyl carrier protein [Luteibaculaceae bacterium]|jgi:biotin carboxyl carrier protein